MVHAQGPNFQGGHGDPLTQRTLPLFFEVVRVLIEAGVTVVAEAAFQAPRWTPDLEPLNKLARLRIIRCNVNGSVSFERAARHAADSQHRLQAHGDSTLGKGIADWQRAFGSFEHIAMTAPSLDVDTTDGGVKDTRPVQAPVRRTAGSRPGLGSRLGRLERTRASRSRCRPAALGAGYRSSDQ